MNGFVHNCRMTCAYIPGNGLPSLEVICKSASTRNEEYYHCWLHCCVTDQALPQSTVHCVETDIPETLALVKALDVGVDA